MPLAAGGPDLNLNLKLHLQGADTAALSNYAAAPVPALGRFDVTARLTGSAATPSLSRIEGRVSHPDGMKIQVRGAIRNPGAGEGLALRVKATGPSLEKSGALINWDTPDLGAYDLSVDLSGTILAPAFANIHLQTTSMHGASLNVTGRIAAPLRGEGLDLVFNAEVARGAALGDLLGLDIVIPDQLLAKGHITGNRAALNVADLELTLGRNDLSGAMTVELSGARPRIVAKLHAKILDLSGPADPSAEGTATAAAAARGGRQVRLRRG